MYLILKIKIDDRYCLEDALNCAGENLGARLIGQLEEAGVDVEEVLENQFEEGEELYPGEITIFLDAIEVADDGKVTIPEYW